MLGEGDKGMGSQRMLAVRELRFERLEQLGLVVREVVLGVRVCRAKEVRVQRVHKGGEDDGAVEVDG